MANTSYPVILREKYKLHNSDTMPVVLVVEDEPLIRMSTVDFVEEMGFRVVEAASADEALLKIDTETELQVLLTDIDMPGLMNGVDLAHVVQQKFPTIGIIVVSGYRHAGVQTLPSGSHFFSKPYSYKQIKLALEALVS